MRTEESSPVRGCFLLEKIMVKNATVWIPEGGYGDITSGNAGDFLLLETSDKILLETGDDILLEDVVFTPKAATAWSNE